MKPPEREVMKPLINYPGYKISTLGKVWSVANKKFLTPLNIHGYHAVRLYNAGRYKTPMVSTLVLETFVGPQPKGYKCKHLTGNKFDNRLANLEWQLYKKPIREVSREDRIEAFDAFDFASKKPGGVTSVWPLRDIVRCFKSVKTTKQARELILEYKNLDRED